MVLSLAKGKSWKRKRKSSIAAVESQNESPSLTDVATNIENESGTSVSNEDGTEQNLEENLSHVANEDGSNRWNEINQVSHNYHFLLHNKSIEFREISQKIKM